jgi:hypothetical protein
MKPKSLFWLLNSEITVLLIHSHYTMLLYTLHFDHQVAVHTLWKLKNLLKPSIATHTSGNLDLLKPTFYCEISCSHGGEYEDEDLLGYSHHQPDDGGSTHL